MAHDNELMAHIWYFCKELPENIPVFISGYHGMGKGEIQGTILHI